MEYCKDSRSGKYEPYYNNKTFKSNGRNLKQIIATEKIFSQNGKGYIVAIKYHYTDGSHTLKKVFIPPKKEKGK